MHGSKHVIDTTAQKVVMLLAREWEFKGPPGLLDISEIVAALPLAPSDILAAIKDLFERGLVDMNSLKTSVFLTPEGYATVSVSDSGDES